MAQGFKPDPPPVSQVDRTTVAAPSQPIRIVYATPSQEVATPSQQPRTWTGVALAQELGIGESLLRSRFKTVKLLADHGLDPADLQIDGQYTDLARTLLQSLGQVLGEDRLGAPRWLRQEIDRLKSRPKSVTAEVVEPDLTGTIALYQQRNSELATSNDQSIEEVLTDVQAIRSRFGSFRRQRQAQIVQQAAADAAADFRLYEQAYESTTSRLETALGNDSAVA